MSMSSPMAHRQNDKSPSEARSQWPSFERFHRGLERDIVIRHMKLVNVDTIETQTLQASFDSFSEMPWTGVVRPQTWPGPIPSTLGCDDQSGGVRKERFSDELFGSVRAIRIGSVDQVHAEFDRPAKCGKCSGFIRGRSPDTRPHDAHRAVAQTINCEITADCEGTATVADGMSVTVDVYESPFNSTLVVSG